MDENEGKFDLFLIETAVLEYVRKCLERNPKCSIHFFSDFDRAGIEMMETLK